MTDTPTERAHEGAWARLRHHKVVQWTLAYGAAAYTLLHVVEMLSGALEWPHVIVRVVTLLLLLGLPVATTLAWFHGHKAQQRVSGPELALLTLLLVAAGAVLWILGRPVHERTTARVATQAPAPGAREAPAWQRPDDKSLAVLPLVDMTPTGGNAYFGDGLSEELSAQLARIPGVRVSARTSAFEFKGKNVDVRRIGEALGVRYVLEGSVRRDDNRLRVTVQLIDSDNGYHVWAETYDREWRDVIAVQEDISRKVAYALKIVLTPEAERRLRHGQVTNLDAYDRYLAGASALRQAGGQAQLNIAVEEFRQALQLDPGLAQAYAGLCQAGIRKYYWTSVNSDVAAAETACRQALEIDPTLKETEIALGNLYLRSGRQEQAEAIFRGLVQRFPNDAEVQVGLGRSLAHQHRNSEAEQAFRTAVDAEPGYWAGYMALGNFLMYEAARTAEATEVYRRATQLAPGNAGALNNLGAALIFQQRLEDAAAAFEKSLAIEPSFDARSNLGTVYYALGRYEDALRQYESAEALAPLDPTMVGNRADALWMVPGRRGESKRVYQRAIDLLGDPLKLDPTNAVLWAQLAHYCSRAGQSECAAEGQVRAEALGQQDGTAQFVLAGYYAERGDDPAAIRAMLRAEKLGVPRAWIESDLSLRRLVPRLPTSPSAEGRSAREGG